MPAAPRAPHHSLLSLCLFHRHPHVSPPLLLSHLLSFSASPSCLTGSVCSGPSSHSPLLCDPLCFHQSLTCKNIVCFGDSFLCHLVKKSLKPLALKKVIKVFQGHTKATLVTFCSITSPQGFCTSSQLFLSLHLAFLSVSCLPDTFGSRRNRRLR